VDKNKVAQLAKSMSTSCKQAVKTDQLTHKLTSPAVALIVAIVLDVVSSNNSIDKGIGWGA